MNEDKVMEVLRSAGVDLIASLPCDRNKLFTSMIHDSFDVVDLTREEDGVGICAGAYMGGRKPLISIQSSGLGNMMNALMSLTSFYGLPLPILASWRGVDNENIEAQKSFNTKIPAMLDAFGIAYGIVRGTQDIPVVDFMVRKAFEERVITVILVYPSLWGASVPGLSSYPPRNREVQAIPGKVVHQPRMTRLDAIRAVMSCVREEDIVVSNIGVPSKEVYAVKDRDLNFYMLGSYTQATPIGLGLAISTDRHVYVIDGDGSLLGSSVLSVVASVPLENLTIICLDNGTFGSTGNQVNQSYSVVDMESLARANGISDTSYAENEEDIKRGLGSPCLPKFLQIMIVPYNSSSPNIQYTADFIRNRFMEHI